MKIFRKNAIFINVAFSYLAIIFLILIIGLITYNQVLSLMKESVMETTYTELENRVSTIDGRLKEVENLTSNLTFNQDLTELYKLENPISVQDYYKLRKFLNVFKTYTITNNFIKDVLVYIKDSDVIISTAYISDNPNRFYDSFMSIDQLEFEDWKKTLFERKYYGEIFSEKSIMNLNESYKAITYILSLPVELHSSYRAVAYAIIDKETIISLVGSSYGYDYLMVKNQDGQMLFQQDNMNAKGYDDFAYTNFGDKNIVEKIIDGEKMFVAKVVSDIGWEYYYATSIEPIITRLDSFRNTYVLALIIVLVLGGFFSFLLAYRNTKPVKRITKVLNNLRVVNEDCYGYDEIEGSIQSLAINNKKLAQDMILQRPLFKMGFFEKLLNGKFESKEEMEKVASQLGLSFKSEAYRIVAIKIEGLSESYTEDMLDGLQVGLTYLEKQVLSLFEDNAYTYLYQEDKLVVVFRGDEEKFINEEIFKKNMMYLMDTVTEKNHIELKFGISSVRKNPMQLYVCFTEALQALQYAGNYQLIKIRWYHQIPNERSGYRFPIELEMRLINLSINGQKKEAIHVINEIYENNIQNKQMTAKEIRLLLHELYGASIKILNSIELEDEKKECIDNEVSKLFDQDNLYDVFKIMKKFVTSICNLVDDKRKNQQDELIMKMKKYIDTHYHDFNLSLQYVSSEFDIAEKYLSQFFKKHIKKNFSDYVLELRMEKAKAFLDKDDMPIKDIAKLVGYYNLNTFYKAFKRHMGVSPSVYRKQKHEL